jgi:hypothetical protein
VGVNELKVEEASLELRHGFNFMGGEIVLI